MTSDVLHRALNGHDRRLLSITAVVSMTEFEHALEEPAYDLIVTEVKLGWGDIRQLLAQIKQTWPNCPVLLYTAVTTAAPIAACFKLGATDYLRKPQPDKLVRAVKQTLDAPVAHPKAQFEALHELFEMAISLSGTFEPAVLMQKLFTHIDRLFAPNTFIAVFYDPLSDTQDQTDGETEGEVEIALALVNGQPIETLPVGLRLPLAQAGITGWLIRHQQPILIQDMATTPPPVPIRPVITQSPRTWLGTPLLVGQRVVGAISVQSFTPGAFSDSDRQLIETLATFVALAVDNAILFQREARRRLGAEALVSLATTIIQDNDLSTILTHIIQAVVKFMPDISNCRISLLDEEMTTLTLLQSWTRPDETETDAQRHAPLITSKEFPLAQASIAQRAIATRQPVVVPDLRQEQSLTEHTQEAAARGLRSMLYVPMQNHGRVLGILHINVNHRTRRFSEHEINLCQSIANYGLVALQNARLRQGEQTQLNLNHTLREVGSLLTSEYALDEVYERIFDLLAKVIQYDMVTIQLYDREQKGLFLAAVRGFDDTALVGDVVSTLGFDYVRQIMESGQPYRMIADTQLAEDWVDVPGFTAIRSTINCLLRIKDRVIGILNVDNWEPNAYTEESARIVLAFANQAAIALENARLYDELQQRINELSIINQVTMVSTKALYLDELLTQTTAVLSAQRFPAYVGFYLLDEVDRYYIPHPSFHTAENFPAPTRIPIQSDHPLAVAGRQHQIQIHDPQPDLQNLLSTQVSLPLLIENKALGLMTIGLVNDGHHLTDNDRYFLQTLVAQLSTAVQRTNLYEDAQFYAAQLADKVYQRTAELQAEKDRTQTILDTAGEGIFFIDPNGKILYANNAITTQSGYLVNELIGQSLYTFYQHPQTAATLATLRKHIETRQEWRGEIDNLHRDGSLYTVSVNMTPLADSLSQHTGFVIVQADISHLKEVERLKSDFVSNVSHELRTPLTNIKTYLTLLRRGKPEKAPRYLNVLDHETERLARLIQDLLDLSRLDTESTVMALQPTPLTAVVEEILPLLIAQAEAKEQTFTWEAPPTTLTTLADMIHLPQSIHRLALNAIAYTPQGGHITLSAGQEESTDQVYFRIRDNGLGLSEEDRQHLFERFFRGTAAHQTREPGTGLGLAISQEIVNRHQGHITADNNPDQGATFTIWLPAHPA
ncbi:MAG: GAF domain-containing protein [Anaerolineales bacterium]|nr:GAF domain-containing protein [Anaerolineales bacterium]